MFSKHRKETVLCLELTQRITKNKFPSTTGHFALFAIYNWDFDLILLMRLMMSMGLYFPLCKTSVRFVVKIETTEITKENAQSSLRGEFVKK